MKQLLQAKFLSVVVALIFMISGNAFAEGKRNWASQGFASDNNYSITSPSEFEKTIDVTAVLPNRYQTPVSSFRGYSQEKCVTCHDGIEEVSASHPKEFGCTVCHGGNGASANKEQAHSTLIYDPNLESGKGNPSALATASLSCGQAQCHSGHEQEDRNHIQRVRKSIMSTMAGVISNLRFQWGGQTGKESKYGAFEVADKDGKIPRQWGALSNLSSLPFFSTSSLKRAEKKITNLGIAKVSGHIGDGVIREKCFKCHLGEASSDRSNGCATCHFTRGKDNHYKGNDPTINKKETGHTAYHKMTALPERAGCLQCHKNFSIKNGNEKKTISNEIDKGKFYLPGIGKAKEDVHFKAGLECIDCHTQFDIMGDGNIYSSQFQAVEIRCETCHGRARSLPSMAQISHPDDRAIRLSRHYNGLINKPGEWMAVSARGRKLTNVKAIGSNLITFEKRSGKKHKTPLVKNGSQPHFLKGHKRLGCTACHSQWAPTCIECEIVYNQSKEPEAEYNNPLTGEISEPVLIMGPRGEIVTMTPRHQKFTAIDEKKNLVDAINKDGDSLGPYQSWSFTNPMGYSGSHASYASQPHSVGRRVRTCESCHISSTALGLGGGEIVIGKNSTGKYDKMMPLNRSNIVSGISELDPNATVTLRGEKIAGSGQPGARPLNQKEITRVLKIGNCIPCHGSYGDKIYNNINKSYKFEKTVGHRNLRKKILK
ncbi:MAG: hypothetical protein ACQ9MH_05160 [Nitrospinales bacterium]